MIRVYVAIKDIMKQQIFIAYGQLSLRKPAFPQCDTVQLTPLAFHTTQTHIKDICYALSMKAKENIDNLRNQKTYQGWDPWAACQLADTVPPSAWQDSACMQMQATHSGSRFFSNWRTLLFKRADE